MDLFVDCPNCGKTLTYGPMNAGAVWICAACGSRVQLPAVAVHPVHSGIGSLWLVKLFEVAPTGAIPQPGLIP